MSRRKQPARRPAVEGLEPRALLSSATTRPPAFQLFRVDLIPLNGSGVSGRGLLTRVHAAGATSGQAIDTLAIAVAGLEQNQEHAVSLTGFSAQTGKVATIPPASAATLDPSAAGLGSDVISESEGSPFYGPTRVSITPLHPTRPGARLQLLASKEKFDANAPDPTAEAIVVRGMSIDGTYQPTVPLAIGVILPFSSKAK
jgi:hypothetical protein